MKRWLSLFLCCVLAACLLCSCQPKPPVDRETLCYPGLSWGMTPQEVLGALGLTESQVEITEEESVYGFSYSPQGDMFGQQPDAIWFQFSVWGSSKNLSQVIIAYPENNDEILQSLKNGITAQYGPLQDTVILGTDSSVFSPDEPPPVSFFDNQESNDEWVWVSSQKFGDMLTEEEKQFIQSRMSQAFPSSSSPDGTAYWSNPDYFSAYQKLNPVAQLSLISKQEGYLAYLWGEGCSIRMSAGSWVGIRQLFENTEQSASSEVSSGLS